MKQQTRTIPKQDERRPDKRDAPFLYPGAKLARKALERKLTLKWK